jgi:hypothetical protein
MRTILIPATPDSVEIAHYGAAALDPLKTSIRRELTFGSSRHPTD